VGADVVFSATFSDVVLKLTIPLALSLSLTVTVATVLVPRRGDPAIRKIMENIAKVNEKANERINE